MTFKYTHSNTDFDSSLVTAAFYNADDRSLAVVLNGYAEDDGTFAGDGYAYSNVPKHEFDALVASSSAGAFYNSLKRKYGPSKVLGWVDENDFNEIKTLVTTGVGTPKNLTYAANATVNGGNTFTEIHTTLSPVRVSLAPKPVEPKEDLDRTHVVHFTVDGGNNVKTYSVVTDSVGKSVDALHTAAEALGVEVNVKGVFVHFE